MKFEKINGKQYIILEKNDEIYLTTDEKVDKESVIISKNKDKINISGNSNIVNSIRGDGMLEKVYIPPILASKEIIDKCETWLEMFKKVHDIFKKLVLSEKYKKQKITMKLEFKIFSSYDTNENQYKYVYYIGLDLYKNGCMIQDGVSIKIDGKNNPIFAYLMAEVINYYLLKNYENTQINLEDNGWHSELTSNIQTKKEESTPISAHLYELSDFSQYLKIMELLLLMHNLGEPTDQIMANLKSKIPNQTLPKRIAEAIDYSKRQYKYIVAQSVTGKRRTLKQKE